MRNDDDKSHIHHAALHDLAHELIRFEQQGKVPRAVLLQVLSKAEAAIEKLESEVVEDTEKAAPPACAEFLLGFIADSRLRESFVGDAFERFRERCADPNCGPRRAKRMYWQELFWSAWPLIWSWVKRSGLWGAIGAGVSRFFS